jgi:galactose mutarotase-like enzyme
MQSISNDVLQVTISAKGAELQNIQHLENGLEYLWNGDANFWERKVRFYFQLLVD